ncbi:hypothetical protein [Rhizobacter sp. P5_C2]
MNPNNPRLNQLFNIHPVEVPSAPSQTQESKTKPIQATVREVRSAAEVEAAAARVVAEIDRLAAQVRGLLEEYEEASQARDPALARTCATQAQLVCNELRAFTYKLPQGLQSAYQVQHHQLCTETSKAYLQTS